jgi:hypothetical protein
MPGHAEEKGADSTRNANRRKPLVVKLKLRMAIAFMLVGMGTMLTAH